MNSNEEGEKYLNEGKVRLMRMEWPEAESAFKAALKVLDTSDKQTNNEQKPEDGYDWMRIEALTGLGEFEARTCQRFCYDDLTWFRCMFRSLAFYNEALNLLLKKKKNRTKTKPTSRRNSVTFIRSGCDMTTQESAFYNQTELRVKYQIKTLEEQTNSALADKILANCFPSSKGKPVTFDDNWLKQLTSFCLKERERATSACLNKEQNDSTRSLGKAEPENFQPVYKRKIDYERVQEAIMRLVNDVSIDVRRHYSYMTRLVPQKLIQQRLMLEITRRLAPGSRDNLDLMQVLEDAIIYEEVNSTEKEEEKINRLYGDGVLAADRSTIVDIDEDVENEETLYLPIEATQRKSSYMKMTEDCGESGSFYNVKDLTRASSPSCQSKKSHYNRFLQQLETASSSRVSRATCTKTVSSRRSGMPMFDAGSRMPSKATRMKNILTVWRANRTHGSISGASSSTTQKRFYSDLQSFEEVSPLTEREKVLKWLQNVEEPSCARVSRPSNVSPNTTNNQNVVQSYPSQEQEFNNVLSSDQLNFIMVISTKKAADNLSRKEKIPEALGVYKFALTLLKANSSKKKQQEEMVAELLKNIGMTKCSLGQITAGCQLMQESVGLYSRLENEDDALRVSEIWYQLGGAFLSEGLRKDSLFLRTMQLVQKELDGEEKTDFLNYNDSEYRDDVSESSEESDGYCVCIYEAIECYKQALKPFNESDGKGFLPNTELYLKILCDLADCCFMAGNLEFAETHYEEALLLFPKVRGASTVKENSHVLSMLGSLNFLLGNYTRSATMFETSHILNQHRGGNSTSGSTSTSHEETSLQQAWNLAMLGLSYYYLGHFDKTVAWCTRAFSLYTRVLKGALFCADYYNHWFVVENLYSLGTAYTAMEFFEKGVYYLNLGKNLINGCEVKDRQDAKQHVKVLRALADAHASLEESDVALRFYEKAVEISKQLGENNTKTALQNQLLNRMASVNVDTRNYEVAGSNLEQALDYQRDVEASIKADMAAVLRRLGATSVLACDVDKAIACYKDCIQAYRELHWLPGGDEEIVKMLCTLAILYHVKSCTIDDENQVELFMTICEGCFQEAIAIAEANPTDISRRVESCIDLQYANFLYQQGLYADALHSLLPLVFCHRYDDDVLVYSGIEQAVLPDHLQSDFNDDTMLVEAQIFAYFLAILCYKNVGLTKDADDVLLLLYKHALSPSSSAFACNVCAYALLEMGLYIDACEIFFISATYKQCTSSCGDKSGVNFWICLCLSAYMVWHKFSSVLFEKYYYSQNSCHRKPMRSVCSGYNLENDDSLMSSVRRQRSSEAGSDLAFCSDSGGEMMETWEEWTEEFYIETVTENQLEENQSKEVIVKVEIPNTSEKLHPVDNDSNVNNEKTVEEESIIEEEVVYNDNFYQSTDVHTTHNSPINDSIPQQQTSILCRVSANQTTATPTTTVKLEQHNERNDCLSMEVNGNNVLKHDGGDGLDARSHGDEVGNEDDGEDNEKTYEEWVTFEEVVDTPIEILTFLNNNNNRLVASSYM